ncbi:hypothetical protein VTL71DRAFT_3058 [Oculimacula yallundae]|uniref:Uncharacterized protein n=1 Tax=Oculimacula yallundae TaxID=86028 RepID=A0ABR4C620_9HELO
MRAYASSTKTASVGATT